MNREGRLAELRSCGVDEERIEKAIELESKLKQLTNHRLRSTACDIAEKLHETAINLEKYIEEKDYIWAADDILLLVEYGNRLKHELLRVGINVDE